MAKSVLPDYAPELDVPMPVDYGIGPGDCIECGHPFDPAESTSPQTCADCLAFTEWFVNLTPAAREEVTRDVG